MDIFTVILSIMVISFVYFYFTTFFEIKKEPIKKYTINSRLITGLGSILLFLLILLLIFYFPLSGLISNDNKSYVGSIIGSSLAVLGAVAASLISVNLSKKYHDKSEFPKKYAKLQILIMNSRNYVYSLETLIFNKDILDDPDKYMFKKLDEFLSYFNQTLEDLAFVNPDASLKFVDLFREEITLANSILQLRKKHGSINMYSHAFTFFKMFQSDGAKNIISKGRKIDNADADDTPYRLIDGIILSQIFLPAVEKKVSKLILDLNEIDITMRTKTL